MILTLGFPQIFWLSKLSAVGLIFPSHSPLPRLPYSTELLWVHFSIKLSKRLCLFVPYPSLQNSSPGRLKGKTSFQFHNKLLCEICMWNLWSQWPAGISQSWHVWNDAFFQTWCYREQETQTGGQKGTEGHAAHLLCPSRSTKAQSDSGWALSLQNLVMFSVWISLCRNLTLSRVPWLIPQWNAGQEIHSHRAVLFFFFFHRQK